MSRNTFRWAMVIGMVLLLAINCDGVWRGLQSWRESSRVSRGFEREFQARLPKQMTMSGQTFALHDVAVTRITHGEKGYCLDVEIHYTGATTQIQATLTPDGFGHYVLDTTMADLGHIFISVPA